MELQYSALKNLMESDEVNMKNMLVGKPQPLRQLRVPQSSEKRQRKIKNSRRSLGATGDNFIFDNSKGFSKKSQVIDLSNTLLNKPYLNPNKTKISSDKSQSQLKLESLTKEINKLEK